MVPAYRSATSRASAAISGVSTRSGETTRSSSREPTLVLAGRHPFEQVTAGELPREPHPDPAAGHRRLRHPFRHEVVEGPVEMRQGHVDEHPGDRQFCGDGAGGRWTAAGAPWPAPAGAPRAPVAVDARAACS